MYWKVLFYFVFHQKVQFSLHGFCRISDVVTNVPRILTLKATELCESVTSIVQNNSVLFKISLQMERCVIQYNVSSVCLFV
jgi:hypothetical protein